MNRDNIATLRIAALVVLILSLAVTGLSMQAAMKASAAGAMDFKALLAASLAALAALSAVWLLVIARNIAKASAKEAKPAAAIQAAAPPRPKEQAAEPGAEALMLLALLQEKGRFVDFVMEDVASYTNEQVGAAARVVHQGCRTVIIDAFSPLPVAPIENARITLEPGYDAEEFRLVGRTEGSPPFTVKVTHKGWRAQHVKLPRRLKAEKILEKPIIVPAEVAT